MGLSRTPPCRSCGMTQAAYTENTCRTTVSNDACLRAYPRVSPSAGATSRHPYDSHASYGKGSVSRADYTRAPEAKLWRDID